MSLVVAEGARLRSGRYELDRPLGRGAAATVWLARDTLLERPVAVKVLAEAVAEDRGWLARFKREARIAARLQHPNLVPVYDFEADIVEGELQSPDGELLTSVGKQKQSSLIEIRKDFIPEMLKSLEDV
jgi:serine/threonine protein kinase